jgi:hypothetical protein
MAEEGRLLPPDAAFQALFTAIDDVRRRPKDGRSPKRLGDELVHLRRATDLLELEFSETAGAFAATEEYDAQGSTTPTEWIRHHCKMTGSTAADRVNVGEQLAHLPQSAVAVVDGVIGFAHLSVIARTASALTTPTHEFVETQLLELARAMSVGRLTHQAVHIRHAADPDGVAAEERSAVHWRRLALSPMQNGRVMLWGELDPVGAATLRTALEPLARSDGPADEREYDRRLADALIELATHALDMGALPSKASQRPHLQVSCSLDTLRGLAGSPAGELELSLPISSKTVQRLACDSSVIRVLLGADSAIIDVGRARRVVPASTRRALNARDRHCQWPGCDRPPTWSAAHHVVFWGHGGKTDLDNLVLICHRHHRLVHEGNWELAWNADGEVRAFPALIRDCPWARSPEYAAA